MEWIHLWRLKKMSKYVCLMLFHCTNLPYSACLFVNLQSSPFQSSSCILLLICYIWFQLNWIELIDVLTNWMDHNWTEHTIWYLLLVRGHPWSRETQWSPHPRAGTRVKEKTCPNACLASLQVCVRLGAGGIWGIYIYMWSWGKERWALLTYIHSCHILSLCPSLPPSLTLQSTIH